MENKFKKGFVVPLVIAIIAVLLIAGGIYVSINKKAPNQTVQPVTATSTAGWKTYTNEKAGFILRFPPSWEIREKTDWSVTLIDSSQSDGPLNSDEQRDIFKVGMIASQFSSTCKVTEWDGSGGLAYDKQFCIKGDHLTAQVSLIAVSQGSMVTENKILSTFNFTK